jgi:hypothetical protein
MRSYLVLMATATLILGACKKKANIGTSPIITYQRLVPNTVQSGSAKDTVNIIFTIQDGDGDIGNDPQTGVHDIYLKDSRSNQENPYFLPTIPSDAIIPGEGINAACTLRVYASLFLLLRPDHPDGDTLDYEIYVKDKAGHKSNVIKTDKIYITP